MDSLFKVPLTTILKVEKHSGADKLDVCTVYGFQVITQKDKFKVGDQVIYVPVDSILSEELEATLFPKDSKIVLHKRRVKQIKIRSLYSQGMLIAPNEVAHILGLDRVRKLGTYEAEEDLAAELGVTKYEPPAISMPSSSGPKLRNKKDANPHFRTYNGIQNIKWTPNRFENEEVVIQLKVHGTNTRFMKAPFVANTLWKKILKFLRLAPKYEFVYGSNNVELTNKRNYKGFYGEDIYGACLERNLVEEKIYDGECVYGEIYGANIQGCYDYGTSTPRLIIFDVRIINEDGTQKWLNPEEAEAYANERGFDFVPTLYKGPFSKEVLEQHTTGPDLLWPRHPREGCVVKSRYNYDIEQNKQCLKSISPIYLADQKNTDFH